MRPDGRVGPDLRVEPDEQVVVARRGRSGGNRHRRPVGQFAHRLRKVDRVGRGRPVDQHRQGRHTGVQRRLDLDPHRVAHVHQASPAAAVRTRRPVGADHDADDVAPGHGPADLLAQRRPPAHRRRPHDDRAPAVAAAQCGDDAAGLGGGVGSPVAEVDPWPPTEQAAAVHDQRCQGGQQGPGDPLHGLDAVVRSAEEQHHEERDVERARPQKRACVPHGTTRRRCRCRGVDTAKRRGRAPVIPLSGVSLPVGRPRLVRPRRARRGPWPSEPGRNAAAGRARRPPS